MGTTGRIVILIGGCAGHGKDTFAEMLREVLDEWTSVRLDAYARTLKEVAHTALGIPDHILHADKSIKESTCVRIGMNNTDITVRKALQDIGEWFRQTFGHLIWASSVRARAETAPERISIITDARHPKQEIHWMKENCDFAQRTFAVRVRNSRVPVKRGHPSEDLIADEPDTSFEFVIETEGTLEDLRRSASELACAIVFLTKTARKRVKRAGDGWGVTNKDGVLVVEPLVTEEDAESVAKGTKKNKLKVAKLTYQRLQGSACGR